MESYLTNASFVKGMTNSEKEMIKGLVEDGKQYLVLNKDATA